jgi:hypothetical protein
LEEKPEPSGNPKRRSVSICCVYQPSRLVFDILSPLEQMSMETTLLGFLVWKPSDKARQLLIEKRLGRKEQINEINRNKKGKKK